MHDIKIEKVARLLVVEAELREKHIAVMKEIRAIVHGQESIGDKLKACEAFYSDAWETIYHAPYVFTYTKDRVHLKRWLSALSVSDIQWRMMAYLKSTEPFYVKTRHSFACFVATFNQHAPLTTAGRPVGCDHVYPCADEFVCTSQKQQELRS